MPRARRKSERGAAKRKPPKVRALVVDGEIAGIPVRLSIRGKDRPLPKLIDVLLGPEDGDDGGG